ncbi:hypothetical protein ACHMW5_22040 (plasmid) [Azospirillum melinis]|uniref:hypothetical protein n=1 Tax=Azospirillum melinis TaxID=328839 RepID=UPI003757211B
MSTCPWGFGELLRLSKPDCFPHRHSGDVPFDLIYRDGLVQPPCWSGERWLIRQAMKRLVNDQPETKPMSPDRLRWTETMLWTAAALLNPHGLSAWNWAILLSSTL